MNEPGPGGVALSTRSGPNGDPVLKPYIIYYKYKCPGDKKPGPITHQKIQADTIDQARQFAERQANYPGMEIVRLEEVPRR